ncbi:ATP-binding protein [Streptomyces sp. NPDC050619]|uniref:ATP-binding protein n=1 Tax=Streptomyces sp. NPDC050619 TaxID=3157214 RepID=UPI0034276A2F
MSVPLTSPPPAVPAARRAALAVALAALVIAVAGVVVAAVAPEAARAWVGATAAVAGTCMVILTAVITSLVRRNAKRLAAVRAESEQLRAHSAQVSTDSAQLANVTVPTVARHLHDGASVDAALTEVRSPADAQLQRLLHVFATSLAASEDRTAAAVADSTAAKERLEQWTADVQDLVKVMLPEAFERLRQGSSAQTVRMEVLQPVDTRLRELQGTVITEFATSERRSAATMAASAKALSRVQATATAILADLRGMQERHGQSEEVFGDLLKLDHSTSQLGLLADRLALLVGGRSSRAWPKPIVMESILRGAVGRIAAFRRVRLHSTSTAAIAGYAAEGVMHLLAELMDNATSFSPPIDEVHVYAEERIAGIVVTVEGGMQMSDGALRRAEEAVSGKHTDLASLQGTRLGLPVVGFLARKFGMTVTYRPSSRGGTGVVVLIPQQLLAQQRGNGSTGATAPAAAAPTALTSEETSASTDREAGADMADREPARDTAPENAPAPAAQAEAIEDLPQRAPGATLAAASRRQTRPAAPPAAPPRSSGDTGSRFRAFRQASQGQFTEDGPTAP